ncbi:hypothetical protein, partial [Corynebacterium otitidis]|uniref:hypothetical protein n=1 Tax=Corynebacterium otitidis TaxID=29321 RepID=UPI0006279837
MSAAKTTTTTTRRVVVVQRYRRLVARFRVAAKGRYAGPATSPAALDSSLAKAEGLDPKAVGDAVGGAVGQSRGEPLHARAVAGLVPFLISIAGGLIVTVLNNLIGEFLADRRAGKELEELGRRTADALDETSCRCDDAASRAVGQLDGLVGRLCRQLEATDPAADPGGFDSCLAAGAGAIDRCAEQILAMVRGRDECLAALLAGLAARVEECAAKKATPAPARPACEATAP